VLSAAQQRIIEALLTEDGEMSFTDLLERTEAGASSIQTLEKRGLVEVFVRSVRRDPLAGAQLPENNELDLTEAQAAALAEIKTPLEQNATKHFCCTASRAAAKQKFTFAPCAPRFK
jgi:primosomal protein N'